MKTLINLKINGTEHEIAVEPYWTLLDVIREKLGFTGTKKGCGTGNCGATRRYTSRNCRSAGEPACPNIRN